MLFVKLKGGDMLQVFENAVSSKDLGDIRAEFDRLISTVKFDSQLYYVDDKDTIRDVYGIDNVDQIIQQERLDATKLPLGDRIRKIFQPYLSSEQLENKNNSVWLCRAHFPIGIHTDTDIIKPDGYTVLMPLTFDESIKTVVWKPLLGKFELDKLIREFIDDPYKFPKKCSVSQELKLDHCWMSDPKLTDVIELDGYASWKKGSIFKFDRRQPHGGNNWKTDKLKYKDYILIHAE